MNFFTSNQAELHEQPEQRKRLDRAITVPVISIDKDNLTGVLNNYDVSLEACSCADFHKRKKPCKHMYKLAMELGIIAKAEIPSIALSRFNGYRKFHTLKGKQPYLAHLDTIIYNEIADAVKQTDIVAAHSDYQKNEVLGAISRLDRHGLILKSKEKGRVYWRRNPNDYILAPDNYPVEIFTGDSDESVEQEDFPILPINVTENVVNPKRRLTRKEKREKRRKEVEAAWRKEQAASASSKEPIKKAGCLVYFGFLLTGFAVALYFVS